ncbi:MAG: hypothetical protein E6355_04900, partial [Streptococcus mitis]|nr:hypothetical protein [Streptococcus mitis]
MDKRIFVEKKADFQVKSESLVRELQHNLGLSSLKSIRIVQVYDVFDFGIKKIYTGKIVEITKHPDADKLQVCQVECLT